jgi:hypothetical protein
VEYPSVIGRKPVCISPESQTFDFAQAETQLLFSGLLLDLLVVVWENYGPPDVEVRHDVLENALQKHQVAVVRGIERTWKQQDPIAAFGRNGGKLWIMVTGEYGAVGWNREAALFGCFSNMIP